ncbi:LysR substrate-binding domain-containing protein [Herbaspirillum huttiense]|jgi:DNA-binding transcriptional LysR family regulator|uniref:LysR substrate-binding domain-containing protein n=1 Tax=Herbaspirillum TaxID=963 RepID=UPI000C094339|nr:MULTISPECIES: LysR substrate-binding domain-containing protein [Herbaspirillum]MAF01793.1 LysR family transcriptional regulator [Herbaspirillum sp.]MBN9359178.1 LysR family transcriptional regulator [Herbaspirillum huttiense]MBO15563.1 LysR family transcriptional regulator [Herbaspirillum sp.]MCP3656174.1 LysR family transcriptional regulator [Herbaspirillum sp.]MCP3947042.1 LysR family transcriptional regulator [Herbaspirillum sp.]|tara:strand:+ start:1026 stop:1889 length:864 start_codon:yes stop_codon:yes gene_type:complete
MELAELEIFRTVVAEGGVTRAAERLNRVQSNVTTRIKQLEESIGVPLFVRDRKRLVLTASGEALLDYAERILDLVQEAREVVSPQNPRGRLRIGSMESAAASRLPAPLAEFHQRWPEVRLELSTGPTDVLIAGVRAGKLDAALVAGPIEDGALSATPLYKEELLLVTPRSHRRVRSPEDVMLDTLIVFEQGCAYRRHAESWFAGQGKGGVPVRTLELASYHAILACVAAGAGVAVVPRSVIAMQMEPHGFATHSLGRDGRVTTFLISRRERSSASLLALRSLLVASL